MFFFFFLGGEGGVCFIQTWDLLNFRGSSGREEGDDEHCGGFGGLLIRIPRG